MNKQIQDYIAAAKKSLDASFAKDRTLQLAKCTKMPTELIPATKKNIAVDKVIWYPEDGCWRVIAKVFHNASKSISNSPYSNVVFIDYEDNECYGLSDAYIERPVIKPCPCGRIPDQLYIAPGNSSKYALVSGCCCREWIVEFRINSFRLNSLDIESDEAMELAIAAWNSAPRGFKNGANPI